MSEIRFYFFYCLFFFNDPATTEIYTLSLHDALPIFPTSGARRLRSTSNASARSGEMYSTRQRACFGGNGENISRSEEHTSELQSRRDLVCRLLLEKKKKLLTYLFNNSYVFVYISYFI